MAIHHVTGPSGAAPGERQEMLKAAKAVLDRLGVASADVVRIYVPARGESEDSSGTVRHELEPMIPVLQSGSLFGGTQGLEIVDAQQLTAAEADILLELLHQVDHDSMAVVLVSAGAVPARLSKFLKAEADVSSVKKMWESNAASWLHDEIDRRGLSLDRGAEQALVQKFGADVASLGQALDQITDTPGTVTAKHILARFKNRPNEPIFHYTDAVTKGDTAEALRRLNDQLVHKHPLVLLATLETEIRRRAIALASPDKESFRAAMNAKGNDRWVDRVWRQRGKLKDSNLRKANEALVKADRLLKSAPAEMYHVTMERLTVALCLWLR